MEAPAPKQHKRIHDIVGRLEEFRGDRCEGLPQVAAAVSSGDVEAMVVGGLDAFVASPKHYCLPVVASESFAKQPSWNTSKETGLEFAPTTQFLGTKGERTASKDGDKADISFSDISRIGGGAALGTAIGTAIVPGTGTVVGAVLGGAVGAFALGTLSRRESGRRGNGQVTSRAR